MAEKPAWWLVLAAERKKQLDAGVVRLREMLPAYDGVRGALIFGSYAAGTVGPESDLDIIVVRDTTLPRSERDDDIRRTLSIGVPYDLITLTPEQYERLGHERSFYRDARRYGLWIDATRTG